MTNSRWRRVELEIERGRIVAFTRAGAAPPLLLVHGNSADHRALLPLCEQPLLASQAAVTFDLPGHGASSPAPGKLEDRYGLDHYARVVGSVADHLAPNRDVVVFGHSLGGHILIRAVARKLLWPAAMAVSGTPPLDSPTRFDEAFHSTPFINGFFVRAPDDRMVAGMAREAFGPHQEAPPWGADAIVATTGEARERFAASLFNEPFANEVETLLGARFPIAVLQAEDDAFVSTEYHRSLARGLMSQIVHIVPRAGHYLPWEHPDVVAYHIERLIKTAHGHPHPPRGE